MVGSIVQRPTRRLRVLCLHGMYQNGAVFAAKTAHLRRGQDTQAEFIYVDGPFTVVPKIISQRKAPPVNGTGGTSQPTQQRVRCAKRHEEFRSWWRPASGSLHVSDTQLDDDREVLVDFLHTKLRELGDVDGVMGFSQGASLASWMCTQQARQELRWSPQLAILIGSYLGPDQYNMASGILPDVASLHMFGSNDHVISAARSQKVVEMFQQVQVRFWMCGLWTRSQPQSHLDPLVRFCFLIV
jgi:predicted esterase